ncbi:uncharacterized protein F5891DRAFT_1166508 [Suillus fuscotomentosus]|uniref:GPN-loop GTPase n=1 Tax=Suillus fuscotomentosus TaxID=1912939 RepID=A0AAD4HCW8_9AGAM|nr:uncharacterized protein F5891DRAFT_1166508 [Suillus fuscotomentosus]KAG1892980.1 hypothetical protein F5891DRAFT_1166508 [Suillus fuscotomentosus]
MCHTLVVYFSITRAGKSTFVQRITSYLHSQNPQQPPYILNLDPAVTHVPFEANIDIRDTVNYKEVMKQYNLGPNGGILTALNLFTTKFDQVLELIEKRAETVDHIILDTPGQIESFTWSASGAIITNAVASSFPTVVAYIIDTPRTTAPVTFMSNMLYACSLMNSVSLVLDEFYKHLKAVSVSSTTGAGIKEFSMREYLPELERARVARENSLQDIKEDSINRLMKDLAVDRAANPKAAAEDRWASDEEDVDDDDELEVNLIDRSE